MKKSAKLLSLLLVLALAVVGLVIGVSAADGETVKWHDARNEVNVDSTLKDGSNKLIYAISYNSYADFLKDKEGDNTINLKDKDGNAISARTFAEGTKFVFESNTVGKYVYFTKDYTFEMTGGVTLHTTKNYTIDLGGNKLTIDNNAAVGVNGVTLNLGSDGDIRQAADFAIQNGNFNIELLLSDKSTVSGVQPISARIGANLVFKDLNITAAHAKNAFIQDSGINSATFENVNFDFSASTVQFSSIINRRGSEYQYWLDTNGNEITSCKYTDEAGNEYTFAHNEYYKATKAFYANKYGVDVSEIKNEANFTFKNVTGTSSYENSLFQFNYAYRHSDEFTLKDGNKKTVNFSSFYEDNVTVNYVGTNTLKGKMSPITCAAQGYNHIRFVNIDLNFSSDTTCEYAKGVEFYDLVRTSLVEEGYEQNVKLDDSATDVKMAKFIKKGTDGKLATFATVYRVAPVMATKVVGETTTKYYGNTLNKTDFTTDNALITLYDDIYVITDADIELGGDYVIDLNGKTLSLVYSLSKNKVFSAKNNANVVIKNGSVYSLDSSIVNLNKNAEIKFEDVKFTSKHQTRDYITGFYVYDGKMSIVNCDIDADVTQNSGVFVVQPSSGGTEQDKNRVELFIDGGKIKVPGQKAKVTASGNVFQNAIYLNGDGKDYAEAVINVKNLVADKSVKPTKFFSIAGELKATSTYNINVKDCDLASGQAFQARPATEGVSYRLYGDGKVTLTYSDTKFNTFALEADTNLNSTGNYELKFEKLDDNFNPTGVKQALIYETTNCKNGSCRVATPMMDEMNANLSLSSDFTLNLYVPVDSNITNIGVVADPSYHKLVSIPASTYAVDEETGEKLVVVVDNVECYVAQVTDINPTNVQDKINLVISYKNGGVTETVIAKYSVLNYAKDYLNGGETTDEGEALIMDTLAYVKAAILLATPDADVSAVEDLLDDYATTVTVPENTETVGTNDYIESATFDIVNNVTLLKLTMKKNATVTVAGIEGTVGEDGCVYVELRAFLLADSFAIYADGNYVGTYSLASYYNSDEVQGASNAVKDLVKALYAYGVSAKAYKVANA